MGVLCIVLLEGGGPEPLVAEVFDVRRIIRTAEVAPRVDRTALEEVAWAAHDGAPVPQPVVDLLHEEIDHVRHEVAEVISYLKVWLVTS